MYFVVKFSYNIIVDNLKGDRRAKMTVVSSNFLHVFTQIVVTTLECVEI